MDNQSEKVILFPKWRTALEEESLAALKDQRFDEALLKLDELIAYGVLDHEIVIGKLICLMELNRYHDAQDLCEELLLHPDEHYYHYVHIYLTILFQTSQYEQLMSQVEMDLASAAVPPEMKEQFRQLYDMSSNMQQEIRTEKSTEYINELLKAVKEGDHPRQYRSVEQIRRLKSSPTDDVLLLLKDDQVHPVTKTAIFMWLQETGVNEKVLIEKLGIQVETRPTDITELDSHPVLKQTRLIISELEQENPSLYRLMEQLMYHYFYVRYPAMPDRGNVESIARALTKIGEEYLDIELQKTVEENRQVVNYMKEIKTCGALFAAVLET
ncbi:tetratricopeptide repeat protein [Lentibacillus lipolyticus]|nr:tetratricopeptide repeat protein [Lentibacillus lipolyticus]